MDTPIEQLATQNRELKKSLALSKLAIDKTQYEYSFLKESYIQLSSRYESSKLTQEQLTRKHQNLQRKALQDQKYLEQRVIQLKDIVEHKQREMEEVQLKILPNLDEDMIRIRVLKEIEEPFEEEIGKKNQQIEVLRKACFEGERRLSLLTMELRECKLVYQKEIDGLRLHHLGQINTVNGSLTQIVEWNQSKEKDKQTIKTLKRSLEEARDKYELSLNQMADLRQQNDILRSERNQLLIRSTSVQSRQTDGKDRYKLEVDRLAEKLSTSKLQTEDLAEAGRKLKAEIKTLKSKCTQLQQQLQRADSDLHSRLLELSSKEKELGCSRQAISQLELKIQTLERTINEMKRYQDLKEVQDMQDRRRGTSLATAQDQRDQRQRLRDASDNRLRASLLQLQELRLVIETLQADKAALSRQISALNKQIQHQSQDQARLTNNRHQVLTSQLKAKLKQAHDTIAKLLKDKLKRDRAQAKQVPDLVTQAIILRENQRRAIEEGMLAHQGMDAALVPLVPIVPLISSLAGRGIYIPTRF